MVRCLFGQVAYLDRLPVGITKSLVAICIVRAGGDGYSRGSVFDLPTALEIRKEKVKLATCA